MEAAKASGAVVDEELVKAADEFSDAWAVAWATFEGKAAQGLLGAVKGMEGFDAAFKQTTFYKIFSRGGLIHQAFGGTKPQAPFESQRASSLSEVGKKSDKGPFTIIPQEAPAAAAAIKSVGTAATDTSTDLEDFQNSLVEVNQGFLEMVKQSEALEGAFGDAFSQLIEGARDGKLGIKEVMGVLDDLSAKLLKMASEKIFELLFAGAFGPTSSSTSAGTGILAGLLGRQAGGPVKAGKPYMVGEAGPELFVPKQSGSIVPGGGGGMAPVINITNMPGVASTQTRSNRGGQDVIDIVNQVVESRFPDLLNRNAGLIGAKPASRRTF
jgi:hypothetical protein